MTDSEILDHVHAVLTRDPRVRDRSEGGRITVFCRDGQVVLAGEVDEIPEKMVSEQLTRSDAEIQIHLMDAFEQDHVLDERLITPVVQDGIVTLTGTVDALAKKRLAGLIAWWGAGVMDVRNHLAVEPAEEDCDDEITDFLRIAFEMDKMVESDPIGIRTRSGVVTLTGMAYSHYEIRAALNDAWAIFGVADVVSKLEIAA